LVFATGSEAGGIYAGDLDSNLKKRVSPGYSNAVYATGHLLTNHEGVLRAQPFDLAKLAITGAAVTVAEGLREQIVGGLNSFSVSRSGILTYFSRGVAGNKQLTWLDHSGKTLGQVGLPAPLGAWAALSPDNSTIAVTLIDAQQRKSDIWLYNLTRDTTSRFTFGPQNYQYPIWSPDGRTLGYFSAPDGIGHPFQQTLDRGKEDVLGLPIGNPPHATMPEDWSRDGQYVERVIQTATADDIWIQPLFGDKKPFPYVESAGNERNGSISPDGKWLLYESEETGQTQIYVQAFPEHGAKIQVSNDGGERPRWSRDGRQIFYISPDLKMIAVPVLAGARFETGPPKALFDSRIAGGFNDRFDVSTDGRFLIPIQAERSGPPPITVIFNWTAAINK
jgi:Tol biopolymer transport system component